MQNDGIAKNQILDYTMLKRQSKNFSIIGYKGSIIESELYIEIKCKNCGDIRNIKIKQGKASYIRCKHCNKTEIAIPKFEETDITIFKSVIIVTRQEYNKIRQQN